MTGPRPASAFALLRDGSPMPRVGLGLWQTGPGRDARDTVRFALQCDRRAAAAAGEERCAEGRDYVDLTV